MPNKRGTTIEPLDLEQARPWGPDRFANAEPQDARGAPGSRDIGELARPREDHHTREWVGVNPMEPILPGMPRLKTGDQGG